MLGGAHRGPLSSEHGTYKTVQAIFWPWLSGDSPENLPGCEYSLHTISYRVERIKLKNVPAHTLSATVSRSCRDTVVCRTLSATLDTVASREEVRRTVDDHSLLQGPHWNKRGRRVWGLGFGVQGAGFSRNLPALGV